MPEKLCTKCKKPRDLKSPWCRRCSSEAMIAYRRTRKGLVTQIHGHQRESSRQRKHPLPDYTLCELRLWMFSQPNFNKLYDAWVKSGYKKDLSLSCDRIDDYKPYTFDNLRLTTWKENNKRGWENRKKGINSKLSKSIYQLSIEGEFVKAFPSIMAAERSNAKFDNRHISACCHGKRKTHDGYMWCFSL